MKNKIRKIDLVKNLSAEIGFSSKYSQKLLDDLIYIIKEKIKKKKVTIKIGHTVEVGFFPDR